MVRWQAVSFPNGRGQKLAGIFGQPANPAKRVVVMCHGFTGDKLGGGAQELAGELARLGWATCAFDFAGCGESEGDFADLTLSGQVGDLTAAVDWCFGQGFNRLVTLGRSFGGSTVVCQAAGDRRVGGVATFAAVAGLTDLFTGFAGGAVETAGDPEEPVYLPEATLKRKFFADLRGWDVLDCAARLSPRPFLVLHGTADDVVPPRDAELLYQAAGEPKRMLLVQGADHQFAGGLAEAWQAFLTWLDMPYML
ncbi:MAG TPA: alpha/beta hydrolase [Spirochaetia bacterium]|nr:alpha/beta hydrolase [Spirochaetia bacterium]